MGNPGFGQRGRPGLQKPKRGEIVQCVSLYDDYNPDAAFLVNHKKLPLNLWLLPVVIGAMRFEGRVAEIDLVFKAALTSEMQNVEKLQYIMFCELKYIYLLTVSRWKHLKLVRAHNRPAHQVSALQGGRVEGAAVGACHVHFGALSLLHQERGHGYWTRLRQLRSGPC